MEMDWRPFFAHLRATKVLRDTHPDQLPKHEEGCLLVVCPDGRRFREKWKHHLDLFGHKPRHHPQLPLGGALIFGENSPLAHTQNGLPRAEVYLDDITTSLRIMEVQTIVAGTHFPCSAALEAGLTPQKQFDLFKSGIDCLRRRFPHIKVVPFCHAHHPGNRHRSYFVDFETYKSCIEPAPIEILSPQVRYA